MLLLYRRGVLIAGGAFGLLHNNGGRNWAFAAWASAVGVVYGAAFLYTEARSASNVLSLDLQQRMLVSPRTRGLLAAIEA